MECGGKRSATPLSTFIAEIQVGDPKRRRRFALPAHSKKSGQCTRLLTKCQQSCILTRFRVQACRLPFRISTA
jgi:hypothetical protein